MSISQAEEPARVLLERLGWTYAPREALAGERSGEREVLLKGRLRAALLRLNDWLTEEQAERAIFELEHINAVGMARNQAVHEYLTFGLPLTVNSRRGQDTRNVRFFDFDHPEGGLNEFVVTTQFRVRRGNEKSDTEDDQRVIKPDLVLFVNGIPLVVMEAKSPSLMDVWKSQAVRQLRRYQEAGPEWRGVGAPELFHYNLLCVAHCGAAAAYAALGAPENAYSEWKSVAALLRGSRCARGSAWSRRARRSSSWGCWPRLRCWTSCATSWSTSRSRAGWSRSSPATSSTGRSSRPCAAS